MIGRRMDSSAWFFVRRAAAMRARSGALERSTRDMPGHQLARPLPFRSATWYRLRSLMSARTSSSVRSLTSATVISPDARQAATIRTKASCSTTKASCSTGGSAPAGGAGVLSDGFTALLLATPVNFVGTIVLQTWVPLGVHACESADQPEDGGSLRRKGRSLRRDDYPPRRHEGRDGRPGRQGSGMNVGGLG